jgi:hypothetical protein
MTGPGTHHYRLFGLHFASEIALPELRAAPPAAPAETPDVTIVRAPVEDPGGELAMNLAATPAGAAFLRARDIGRVRVTGGDRIEVDLNPGQSERNMRLFLLGSAMGALLHQRRLLPLHANAIDVGGRAIAFAGHSRAGKSTLAAAFWDRGFPLLSDDICVVTRGADGGFDAQPGIPRVRLWRDAVERTGRDTATLDPAFDGMDKYVLPLSERHAETALPLAAVFILARARAGAPVQLNAMSGLAATQALVAQTYRGAYVPLVGDSRAHFEQCVHLPRRVPVFTLKRPWDPALIGEAIDLVATQLESLKD